MNRAPARRRGASATRSCRSPAQLDLTMGGPGFRAFGFKDDHSPHYKYEEPTRTTRRAPPAVYRFSSAASPTRSWRRSTAPTRRRLVAERNETLTALQALALLNNRFMVRMAEHFAARVGTGRARPTRTRSRPPSAWPWAGHADEVERELLAEVARAQAWPTPAG